MSSSMSGSEDKPELKHTEFNPGRFEDSTEHLPKPGIVPETVHHIESEIDLSLSRPDLTNTQEFQKTLAKLEKESKELSKRVAELETEVKRLKTLLEIQIPLNTKVQSEDFGGEKDGQVPPLPPPPPPPPMPSGVSGLPPPSPQEAFIKEMLASYNKDVIVKKAGVGGLRDKFRRKKEEKQQKVANTS